MNWFKCPGEGTDRRILRWITCPLQNLLSFHSNVEPFTIIIGIPFYIAINIPLRAYKVLHIRAGFRYDRNWLGYIFPEVAIKIEDRSIFY